MRPAAAASDDASGGEAAGRGAEWRTAQATGVSAPVGASPGAGADAAAGAGAAWAFGTRAPLTAARWATAGLRAFFRAFVAVALLEVVEVLRTVELGF